MDLQPSACEVALTDGNPSVELSSQNGSIVEKASEDTNIVCDFSSNPSGEHSSQNGSIVEKASEDTNIVCDSSSKDTKDNLLTSEENGVEKNIKQRSSKRRKMRTPKKIWKIDHEEMLDDDIDYYIRDIRDDDDLSSSGINSYMVNTENGEVTCMLDAEGSMTSDAFNTDEEKNLTKKTLNDKKSKREGTNESNETVAEKKPKKRRRRTPRALNDKIPDKFYFDITAREKRKMKGPVKNYCCAHCEFSSTRWDRLKEHLIVHLQDRPFACDVCDFKAKTAKTLKRHKNAHSGERQFKCPMCPVAYKRKHSLKEHMNSHSKERMYACSSCDFSTTRSQYLKRHMMKHGESDDTTSILQQHLEGRFDDEEGELYNCSKCDYSSVYRKSLQLHEKTHDEVARYHCGICDFVANTADTLQIHMELHISGEKHRVNGEKQYKCDRCFYQTSRKRDLKRHYINVHDVNKEDVV